MDEQNLPAEERKIIIDEASKSYMLETARWAKFFAIIGFVVLGFAALSVSGLLFTGAALAKELGQRYSGFSVGFSLFYLLLMFLFFYPMYTLLRFANLLKVSVNNFDQQGFDDAFRYLKNTFRFWGIYTIILIFIYGLFLLLATTIAVTSQL